MLGQAFGVLVQVSNEVFVREIYDSEDRVLSDNRQVSGLAIRTDLANCPQPYSPLVTGSEFCRAVCVNSCPELNPDPKDGAGTTIDQNTVELGYLTNALSNAYNDTAELLDFAVIGGLVDFLAPFNTPTDVINYVWGRLENQLPEHVDFEVSLTVCLARGDITVELMVSCSVSRRQLAAAPV